MATCICVADLRERVELQAVTRTRDSVGGNVETWTTFATVWAAVRPMSQRESFYRQQMNAAASWKVGIRYTPDVTTKHRVKWGTRVFELRGISDPDMKRRFLELACDEITAP